MRQVIGTALVMVAMLYAAHVNTHPGRPLWMVAPVEVRSFWYNADEGWSPAREYVRDPDPVAAANNETVSELDRIMARLHSGLETKVGFAIIYLNERLDEALNPADVMFRADLHSLAVA